MRALIVGLGWLSLTVAGAHALGYAVVQLLPDPMISVLGLQSANKEARAAVLLSNPPMSYGGSVAGFLKGDLGTTIDGTAVSTEIANAVVASLPRLSAAILLILAVPLIVAHFPARQLGKVASASSFVAFLPPFLAPVLMLWILLLIQTSSPEAALLVAPWLLCLSIALPAAAIAASQTALVTRRNRELPFAVTIRSLGASEFRLRTRMLPHLVLELAPTFEKLLIGLVTALLFAESIFAEEGLGSLTLRAIRRSDLDLMLALIVFTALLVGLLRFGRILLRGAYGLKIR